jgi:hypothetical protein
MNNSLSVVSRQFNNKFLFRRSAGTSILYVFDTGRHDRFLGGRSGAPNTEYSCNVLLSMEFNLSTSEANKRRAGSDFLGLFFDPEDLGSTFLRNVCELYRTTLRHIPRLFVLTAVGRIQNEI